MLKTYLSFRSNPTLSVYLIFILLTGYLFIHILNGRFTLFDFEVYYRAAERITNGQNLYQIAEDGHYVFKYSPVSAIYFIPLQWLPLFTAKVVYWILSSLAFCYVLVLFYLMGGRGQETLPVKRLQTLYLVSFICIGAFLELELHLGQVNIFILLLLTLSGYLSMQNRPFSSGLLLSLSFFLKPFGLILLFYYLYRRKLREVGYAMLFVLILFFLPLIFYGSFDMFFGQCRHWIQEIGIELSNKQDLLAHRNHTLFSVLARYSPLRWITWGPVSTMIYQLFILLVIGGLFHMLRRRAVQVEWLVPVELGLILCLVPLLAFTNRNLYMCSGMAVALLLTGFSSLHWVYRSLFILGVGISSFNIIEIWGPHITYKLEDWSFIALGTTIVWIVLYISAYRRALSNSLQT